MKYLLAVSRTLVEESIDFEASWRGTQNLSANKKAILKKAGMKNRSAYAYEFTNPGKPDSRYVSISVPLQEIFQESTSVLEDMTAAIEELVEPVEPGNIAYWDSIDPYADVLSMLQGVKNVYYGGVKGFRGVSVSELVAKKDIILDRRVKAGFEHAEKRIKIIRDLKDDTSSEKRELIVKIAVSECEKLTARLTAATPLVTADPAVNPWAAYGK